MTIGMSLFLIFMAGLGAAIAIGGLLMNLQSDSWDGGNTGCFGLVLIIVGVGIFWFAAASGYSYL